MNELDERLGSLADLRVPGPRPVREVKARAQRKERRRRAMAVGVLIVVVSSAALLGRQERRDEVSTANDPEVRDSAGFGTAVVPNVVGLTVDAAGRALEAAGFAHGVNEFDADFPFAVVIAQEPGGDGAQVPQASMVGLRTALPDPPVEEECVGTRHPRSSATADALPASGSVTRARAEQAWLNLDEFLYEGDPAYIGQWNRQAYEPAGNGAASVIDVSGYQIIVVHDSVADCPPGPPTFLNGVPVTHWVHYGSRNESAQQAMPELNPNDEVHLRVTDVDERHEWFDWERRYEPDGADPFLVGRRTEAGVQAGLDAITNAGGTPPDDYVATLRRAICYGEVEVNGDSSIGCGLLPGSVNYQVETSTGKIKTVVYGAPSNTAIVVMTARGDVSWQRPVQGVAAFPAPEWCDADQCAVTLTAYDAAGRLVPDPVE